MRIVFLGVGSPLGESMGVRLEAEAAFSLLSLDADRDGVAISVEPDRVVWDGVDLLEAGAILVERPVFAWPQPGAAATEINTPVSDAPEADTAVWDTVALRRREAAALQRSALLVASLRVPVIPAPETARLGSSPFLGLDRLARHSITVQGHRLLSAASEAPAGSIVLDVCGRDLEVEPTPPEAGDVCIALDPVEGGVLDVLALGGKAVLGARHASPTDWAAGRDPSPVTPLSAEVTALAHLAAVDLSLDLALITVTDADNPRVLRVDAAPDLARLDHLHGGEVADLLARYALDVASGRKGALDS